MEVTTTLQADMITEVINNGNLTEIEYILSVKEKALTNAIEVAEFNRSIGNNEFAEVEEQRARRLKRDIERLSKYAMK
jgi:hypothetical protein|nr:MAG TPA: hypothetical protein [Caudoviricetes sp.]